MTDPQFERGAARAQTTSKPKSHKRCAVPEVVPLPKRLVAAALDGVHTNVIIYYQQRDHGGPMRFRMTRSLQAERFLIVSYKDDQADTHDEKDDEGNAKAWVTL